MSSKNQITITIDLDDLGEINDEGELVLGDSLQATIQERVVSSFVTRLLGAQHKILDATIREQVDGHVKAAVQERLLDILNSPIQKLDSYSGKPIGEPFTIESLAMEKVTEFLRAPARGDYGSTGNLATIIEKTVAEILSKDLKSEISQAREAVGTTLRDAALAGAVAVLTPKAK